MQQINSLLTELLKKSHIDLIDFKVEFGFDSEGNLMLIDEISPDTARFYQPPQLHPWFPGTDVAKNSPHS